MMQYKSLFLFLTFLFIGTILSAQGTQTTYGKNRIQYHDFEWSEYESENFILYWYGGGRSIGQAVAQIAEEDYHELQTILEYRISGKIEILVYNDLTDLKQTNIGNEEAAYNIGGVTKIVDNKVFVYFDGNHTNLREQIREGIARVFINHMLFGNNLQEIVQNAILLNLPKWFTEGIVVYVGEKWNTQLDNRLRESILSGRYHDFEDFAKEDPAFAGHAMWYYISENYGSSTVSNLLYLTRINKSVETGFLYVLGITYYEASSNWYAFFQKRYEEDLAQTNLIDPETLQAVQKRKHKITRIQLSPNGKQLAYVSNDIGKYRIFIKDLETNKTTLVLKEGFRNIFQETDYNYPLITWTKNGAILSVIYEKRDVAKQLDYNLSSKKTRITAIPTQYQRILNASYIDNRRMVLTALYGGQSDVFIYNTRNRSTKRITSDFHDDLDASYIRFKDREGIAFASNRRSLTLRNEKLDTLLPKRTFDLFFYDLKADSKQLVQITNTPFANETKPMQLDSSHLVFLSDMNGINNRFSAYIEDVFAYNKRIIKLKDKTTIQLHEDSSLTKLDQNLIDTTYLEPVYLPQAFTFSNSNYNIGVVQQTVAPRAKRLANLFVHDGQYKFKLENINVADTYELGMSNYMDLLHDRLQTSIEEVLKNTESPNIVIENNILEIADTLPTQVADTNKIDIDNYYFQSEFEDENPTEASQVEAAIVVEQADGTITLQKPDRNYHKNKALARFDKSQVTPYRIRFKTDYLATQLDNSFYFDGRNFDNSTYFNNIANQVPQTNYENLFQFPLPNIVMKGGVKDIFEDYKIEGGMILPVTFDGSTYFISFEDRKKRLDKSYLLFQRRSSGDIESVTRNIRIQTNTTGAQFKLTYPLNIFTSIRGIAMVRMDKSTLLATDRWTLDIPSIFEQRISTRLEYVFDNTLSTTLNIRNGSRYKFFAEAIKPFQVQFNNTTTFQFNQGWSGVLGVDARHYQRLDKHSIIAARFAAETSFGTQKILYFMGGMDNWLFPSNANSISTPTSDEFAFQMLASNMRGFRNNIRNGSSYALFNTELRIPVFNYFSNSPIRYTFLRNFQAVGFFDIGTAWLGASPFSDENPLNTVVIQDPNSPIKVQVNYFRNPIVSGYGFGMRSLLFGYFIRLDYAWGIETGQIQDPILYLSLGMDF